MDSTALKPGTPGVSRAQYAIMGLVLIFTGAMFAAGLSQYTLTASDGKHPACYREEGLLTVLNQSYRFNVSYMAGAAYFAYAVLGVVASLYMWSYKRGRIFNNPPGSVYVSSFGFNLLIGLPIFVASAIELPALLRLVNIQYISETLGVALVFALVPLCFMLAYDNRKVSFYGMDSIKYGMRWITADWIAVGAILLSAIALGWSMSLYVNLRENGQKATHGFADALFITTWAFNVVRIVAFAIPHYWRNVDGSLRWPTAAIVSLYVLGVFVPAVFNAVVFTFWNFLQCK